MKDDFNFEAIEKEKWMDINGFSRQVIMNGKGYEKILPPSAKMNAKYVVIFFYNFVL